MDVSKDSTHTALSFMTLSVCFHQAFMTGSELGDTGNQEKNIFHVMNQSFSVFDSRN